MKIRNNTVVAILFGSICLDACVYAAPKPLTGYDQLVQALHQGNDVKAIVYINRCTLQGAAVKAADPVPETDTRLNFNVYSHYKVLVDQQEKYAVATSVSILTEHRAFGPVYAYGRLRVFEDNTAEYHAAYYDPQTYAVKGSSDWICHISNDADQSGLMLFVDAN